MNQPQNLRADDLLHRSPLAPVATPTDDPVAAQLAVATPTLSTPVTTGAPASVQYADHLTPEALALRLKAITRLGVVPTATRLSTLTALTTLTPQAATPATTAAAPAETPQAPTTAEPTATAATAATAPQPEANAPGTAPTPADPAPADPTRTRLSVLNTQPEANTTGAAPTPANPAPADLTPATAPELTVVTTGAEEQAPAPAVVQPTGLRPGVRVPEVRVWAGRLVGAVGEVLAGDRPVSQLVRFTDEGVFAELNRRVRLLGLSTTAGSRRSRERCVVRSVRVCQPVADVAEVAAHVRHGGRSRAIALRLEIRRNRWVCTALEVG
jgi:hypothetical protein